ncbi:MAG: hypothetical protein KGQ89_04195 [Verrucomicrobia bacterium]|nr:hypothetical protein [Verrucomicrobiota bacterium]
MQIQKRLVSKIFATAVGLVFTNQGIAAITAENERAIKQLNEMTDQLRATGAGSFVISCNKKSLAAPKFLSAWYIARLPNDIEGSKQLEEAKSNLGLEIARQLSVVAKTVRETNDIPALEQASETLFSTAKWVGTQLGYGNLVLQDRAYDIASVAAIKFMADLAYPMEKAEAVMKRFDWNWGDASKRRRVLFEESGGTHFKLEKVTVTDEELDLEFRQGVSHFLKNASIEDKANSSIFVIEKLRDDECFSVPETSWQKRAHFMIGENSFVSTKLRNLESLREFRKRYGKFPTKPVKYVKSETESDIQAAFWELSWENPYGVQSAYMLYEEYLAGRLADKGWNDLRDRSKMSPHPIK